MSGPLKGVKVLDLSRVLAGPWAGQVLADMGADVVKVERPGAGDDTRQWGPPFLNDKDGNPTRQSGYYMAANRGKKSIALDIATDEGQKIIRDLAKDADVLIENYKLGGLAKYGLDYKTLHALNPKLVYCSITGFGQTGPMAHRAGYDFIIQGMGGLMSITGHPETGPVKAGVAISDLSTGMYASIAILGALYHVKNTGQGQHIDMSLLDTQVGWLANQAMNWLVGGKMLGMIGNAHPNITPYQTFETSDGHIIIAVGNDGQFERYLEAVGRADLVGDERFKTNSDRLQNRDELSAILSQAMTQKSLDEWMDVLEKAVVPCGPVNTIDRVFADEQVIARGMEVHLEHPTMGDVPQVRTPILYSETPLEYKKAPPELGEDTDDVLKSMGLDDAQIADLRAKNIVA